MIIHTKISFSRPTFFELLKELNGRSYIPPIQYSLQSTLFNGIIPVLDHHLDLADFKNLDCEYSLQIEMKDF